MNRFLGLGGLVIGFGASLLGILFIAVGRGRRDNRYVMNGRLYAWLVFAGAVLAFAAMEKALIERDFSLKYVQSVGSTATPFLYNITAIWTSLEGSLLLWLLVLGGYLAAVQWKVRARRDDPLVAWATLTMLCVSAFFFGLALFASNPFSLGPEGVTQGRGPNALLQNHILVLFHPPTLYLGYVGMTVPFAFAIAALVTGRVGEGWLVESRRWTLFAWGFLTIGILLGGWWSYEVLGWGGVWGWDAVENASLLPWLTGTAYIHSVMVQERRGMLRVWNLSLLVATFSLTILGTFLTRSGVVASVHAFSESTIGPWLLAFFGLVVAVSLGLIAWRGDRLRSPGSIDSPLSREFGFLANNIAFAVFAFVVLLGTVYPLIVESVKDRQITVGSPYFDALSMPVGLVLLFLMAVAPVLPWRRASTELLRDRLFWPAWVGAAGMGLAALMGASGIVAFAAFGLAGFAAGSALRTLALASRRQGVRGFVGRANGGMVVHLGVILIAVGLAASNSFTRSQTFDLQPDETVEFAGHSFRYTAIEPFDTPQKAGVKALIAVDGGQRYAPAATTYKGRGMSVPTPSVVSGLTNDIYLVISDQDRPKSFADPIELTVSIKPMVLWLWIGGGVTAFGTVLSAFPGKRRRRGTEPVSAPIGMELTSRTEELVDV